MVHSRLFYGKFCNVVKWCICQLQLLCHTSVGWFLTTPSWVSFKIWWLCWLSRALHHCCFYVMNHQFDDKNCSSISSMNLKTKLMSLWQFLIWSWSSSIIIHESFWICCIYCALCIVLAAQVRVVIISQDWIVIGSNIMAPDTVIMTKILALFSDKQTLSVLFMKITIMVMTFLLWDVAFCRIQSCSPWSFL